MSELQICRSCHRPVRASQDTYEVFECMHYVCFHYEFEHGELDLDLDCGVPGCPSGVLPVTKPSAAAIGLLDEVAEALRNPYDADAWTMERGSPGVLHVTKDGIRVQLVAVDEVTRT